MKKIKQVKLTLESIGTNKEWFLVVSFEEQQDRIHQFIERGWLIGRQKEVEEIIEKLRSL